MRLDQWLNKLIVTNPHIQNFKEFVEKLKRHWTTNRMTAQEVALLLESILKRHSDLIVDYNELQKIKEGKVEPPSEEEK